MAGVLGTVSWGIQPVDWTNSNLAGTFWDSRSNYLKSANDQLRYQAQWHKGGLNEATEPSKLNYTGGDGDVVNMIFDVYAFTHGAAGTMNKIGTIKKSRDIASKLYTDGSTPLGHRFTVDVGQLLSNELSYSLCPINKGTWQSVNYGGMNGGVTEQDNVLSGNSQMGNPIKKYNVSSNGTFRLLDIRVRAEIINSSGDLVSTSQLLRSNKIAVINSVNQFEEDITFYQRTFTVGNNPAFKFQFLTRCPNIRESYYKPVRIDEEAEWAQFFLYRNDLSGINPTSSAPNTVGAIAIKIVTTESDGTNNTFYLRDFEDHISTYIATDFASSYTVPSSIQEIMLVQNISPHYITTSGNVWEKTNQRTTYPYWAAYAGDTITSSTISYTATLFKVAMWSPYPEEDTGTPYYYTIDRESENIPYGFVRFHWLNSMGGIDSYTAKRDVVEGLSIDKSIIERKSADRTWYQGQNNQGNPIDTSLYISDTMRGGNLYKGGREVLNINAEKVQSVYTEPLNKLVAKWLKGILLSPNVWIEMDTAATSRGTEMNEHLRPSTKGYIPVIITNNDIETINQSEGLVRFNIEYTLSHKVQTQRN